MPINTFGSLFKIFFFLIPVFSGINAQQQYIFPDFGMDGFTRTDFGLFTFTPENDFTAKLLITETKEIILAGRTSRAGGLVHFCIGYYDSTGKLDYSKRNGGRVVQPISVHRDITTTALLQSNGKVLVGGYIFPELFNEIPMIVRFNSDGSLDTTFSKVASNTYFIHGDTQRLSHLEWGADQKIIGLGYATGAVWPGGLDAFMIQVLPNGELDTQFHNTGKVQLRFSNANERVLHGTKLQDGNYLVCGSLKASTEKENFWVGKITADGSIDRSFGNNGMFQSGSATLTQQFNVVTELPDGSILAGGYEYENGQETMILMKLSSYGILDQDFATLGVWRHKFQNRSSSIRSILFHDNHIFLGCNSMGKVCLIKLKADGNFDTTFGNNGGIFVADESKIDACTEIKMHGDQILVAGEVDFDFAMCKVMLSLSTSITENALSFSDYRIYPNPLADFATIEITSEKSKAISFHILDTNGRLVKTIHNSYPIVPGKQNISLDLSDLNTGTYFLQIQDAEGRVVERVMVWR